MLTRTATICVVALALAFVASCIPPPTPTPAYERCSNVGPDQCSLFYVAAWGGTYADGEAWTTEPPTFISIELTLEKKQPDGTFTGIWIDRSGLGSEVQRRSWISQTIQCGPGVYQWHMRVRFTGKSTTYYWTTDPFVMPIP